MDASRISGADSDGDGRALALIDWDDDGSLDLLLRSRSAPRMQVFHNRYGKPGNFIAFELEGNGSTCNRDAIGTRVTIEAGGQRILRALRAGEGLLAQSSKRLHFGIGPATKVERVSVLWADGSRSEFLNLQAGKRYRVSQADGIERPDALTEIPARTVNFDSLPSVTPQDLGSARRAVLAFELPLGELSVPSFENPERKVRDLAGSPTLLNLWQVECSGCLVEFGDFNRHREELVESGLRIVTLNADADPAKPIAIEEVYSMLERYGRRDADAGYVGELMPRMMQTIEKHIYGEAAVSGAVVMPTSWLLDAKGQLMAIYRGPVHIEQLLTDVEALKSMPEHLRLNRLSHGMRLANLKRKLFDLAISFKVQSENSTGSAARAFQRMSEYYLAEDKLQRGFIMTDGQPIPMKDPRHDGARKSREEQALEQEASGLDDE